MYFFLLRFRSCFLLFFFFQAEDGIRDAQESRGLGDVYKRQARYLRHPGNIVARRAALLGRRERGAHERGEPDGPVSYTHLTLPTIYSV